MSIKKHPHPWSTDCLLNKAQRYATVMLEADKDGWQFGFWSALTLEVLARAALAKISPTLLAAPQDWTNIYYALGNTASTSKPKSIDITEVFKRLETIVPEFTRETHNFCSGHINRRNVELHSGDLAFEGLGTSSWLPMFYSACEILLKSIGENLEILFGASEARLAATLIESSQDKAALAVKRIIAEHKKLWKSKARPERDLLAKQASLLATRHEGHRVKCPSCDSAGLVQGTAIGLASTDLRSDSVIERQSMLPSHFECVACGLKIVGHSKLNACGLGDVYTGLSYYDAADYFDIDQPPLEYFEEDFNE
jgi:hypothetical protein